MQWIFGKLLKGCCKANQILHVRVAGASYSGKTSLIRYLAGLKLDDLAATEGLEVTIANFGGVTLVLYDGNTGSDDDTGGAKCTNFAQDAIGLQYPNGAIFVVDGCDRGRLPLAAKLLVELMENFYRVDVFLILISKADQMAMKQGPAQEGSLAALPSMGKNLQTPVSDAASQRRLDDALKSPISTPNTPLSDHDEPAVSPMAETPAVKGRVVPETLATSTRAPPSSGSKGLCTIRDAVSIMGHTSLMQKEWRVFYVSSETGEGVHEAFEWFIQAMLKHPLTTSK